MAHVTTMRLIRALMFVLVLAALGSLTACARSSPDSGIAGTMLLRETGGRQPTPLPPYRRSSGRLEIRRLPSKSRVAVVRVGADGRFRVALPPGRYLILPYAGPRSILAPVTERRVEVLPHQFTHLVFRAWLQAP